MAQRGGVVESTILLGGWKSPKISQGEADILLGFEPLETLRALPYLAKGGLVVSNTEPVPPMAVSLGTAQYPEIDQIKEKASACAGRTLFLPCRSLGLKAGAVQSGNLVLFGALCATGDLPFGVEALKEAIKTFMRPALAEINLKAVDLGVEAVSAAA